MANRRFIDFPIATTVGDNDIILIWQSGMNKQTTKATLLNGLPENLEDLLDVNITGLTNGQILRYDSVTGKWENTDQGNLDLDDLNDVTIVSPTNGQVLVYNSSTSKWENSSAGFVPYTGAISTVNLGAQTIQAGSFVKSGGTTSQFLKADGSVDSTAYGTGSVTSVGLTMPSAFNVANSPVTTSGTLAVTGAGTVGQYIRGDGSLADFPSSTGGGSSVSYYLNGSVSQGTIGGVAYKELSKVPILGTGTDFTINANGYIAQFLTDAGDPNLLEIPGGNWNFETYFSASSGGGSPTFYVELYKYDGSTFTLIASNSGNPELIAFGTNVTSYFSTLAVPTTALTLTDRLAIRYYVTHSGRTITLHTENNHLCQVITTFTTGLTALNGLTAQVQYFAVGTSGTDFNISSATQTHTFNLPTASASNRGALSSADWSTFNAKQNALTLTTSGSSGASTLVGATLNVPTYTLSGLGGVPTSRQLTINGTTFDLSADRSWSVGTVTSVGLSSATSGVTIGSTPVTGSGTITLAIATASGSQNGLLSSTDWTTFNNKQNALTNPVTGTGTTNTIPIFTGASTIGNSIVTGSSSSITITSNTDGQILQIARNSGAYLWKFGIDSLSQFIIYNNSNVSTFEINPLNANVTFGLGQNVTLRLGRNANDYGEVQYSGGVTSLINQWANTSAYIQQIVNGQWTRLFGTGILDQNRTSEGTFYRFQVNGSNRLILGSDSSSNALIRTGNNVDLRLGVNEDAIVVKNGGNVLIGTTTDNGARLQVSGGNVFFQNLSSTLELRLDSPYGGVSKIINGQAGAIAFETSATERMRITSGGNVLIGGTVVQNTSANRGNLTINGNTSILNLSISDTNGGYLYHGGTDLLLVNGKNGATLFYTNDTERMRITSGGNVLIGTTNDPSARLNIQRPNDSGTLIRIGNVDLNYFDFSRSQTTGALSIQGNQTGFNNILLAPTSGNVGIGTSSPESNSQLTLYGSSFSQLHMQNATTGTGVNGFRLLMDGNNTTLTNREAGYMAFETSDTERMRITSGGNVLIGTTTDSGERLQVRNGMILAELASGSNGAIIKMGRSAGSYYWYLGIDSGASDFNFYNNSGTSVARITPSGTLISATGVYDTTSATNHWFARVQGNNRIIADATGYVYMPFLTTGSGIDDLGWWGSSGGSWTYNGMLMRISSSARYKKNIRDIEIDTSKIYDLRTISYENNEFTAVDGLTSFGLLAEDVAEKIPLLATFNNEGQPEGVQYKMLSVLLLEELKKLKLELNNLKK